MSRLKQAWDAACVKYASNPGYIAGDVVIALAIIIVLMM